MGQSDQKGQMGSGAVFVKLWSDDEVTTRIWSQAMVLMPQNQEKWTRDFWGHLHSVVSKLHAANYHRKNIERIEREERTSLLKVFKNPNAPARECYPLIFETEAFLFQIKSSLDVAVKILEDLCGKGFFRIDTFGDKGNHVIKGLNKFKEAKSRRPNLRAVEGLIQMIVQDKDAWLDKVVSVRNQISHYKALEGAVYMPLFGADGKLLDIRSPKLLGMTFPKFSELMFQNCLEFLQDFISMAIILRLGPGVGLTQYNPEASKMYGIKEQNVKYLKHGLTMVFSAGA